MEQVQTKRGWLLERIVTFGDRIFLQAQSTRWNYAQLRARVTALRLEHDLAGVRPGQVMMIQGNYSIESVACLLELVDRGCIVVPITSTVDAEVEERLKVLPVDWLYRPDSKERVNGASAPAHPILSEIRARHAAGLVLFSSGSTGTPKAMVHDLTRLLGSYHDRKSRDLTMIVFLMFDHIGGLNTLFAALASGATLVVPDSREPDHVCALVAAHKVAVLPASPTFLNLILIAEAHLRHDLSSLRIISYGTEPMPESLLIRLRAAFPRCKFVQTFGTSETGISQTQSLSSSSTMLKLDDPNIEYRVENGELWLRSRTQILGYLNHPMDSFTADGWFKTGDLVEEAGDGFMRIVGRRTEMINVGGQKVLPTEVESILLEMPGIEDCMVYGEASPITGQIVCAKVVVVAGLEVGALRQAVRLHCRSKLDAYKIPVKVQAVPGPLFGQRFKKQRMAPLSLS